MAGQKKKQKVSEKDDLRGMLGKALDSLLKITNGEPFDALVGGKKVMMQAISVDSLAHYRDLDERVDDGRLIEVQAGEAERHILDLVSEVNGLKAELDIMTTQRDSLRKTLDGRDTTLHDTLAKNRELEHAVNQLAIRLADQLRINGNQREFIDKLADEEVKEPEETVDVEDGGKLGESVFEFLERVKGDPIVKIGLSKLQDLVK